MRSIIICLLPMALAMPANNFLSPGRQENYLSARFWRAEQPKDTVSTGVQSESDLGGGFWPSAKFLMLRRRNKLKNATESPSKNNDDAEKGTSPAWEVIGGTKEEETTMQPPQSTSEVTTVVYPIVVPLPPSPTISEVALRAKLLKGTPPRFLQVRLGFRPDTLCVGEPTVFGHALKGDLPRAKIGGSDDAKVSFAKIGMGDAMTKAQLRQAYTDWADKQDPAIKEAFLRQRAEHDEKVNVLRKMLAEKSKDKLSVQARNLFEKIQTIHDNNDLTIGENIGLVQEVMNGADESVRKELRDMKKRFAINI